MVWSSLMIAQKSVLIPWSPTRDLPIFSRTSSSYNPYPWTIYYPFFAELSCQTKKVVALQRLNLYVVSNDLGMLLTRTIVIVCIISKTFLRLPQQPSKCRRLPTTRLRFGRGRMKMLKWLLVSEGRKWRSDYYRIKERKISTLVV